MTDNDATAALPLIMPMTSLYQGVPKPGPKQRGTGTQDYAHERYGLCIEPEDPFAPTDRAHAVTAEDIPSFDIPLESLSLPSTEWTDVNPAARAAKWLKTCLGRLGRRSTSQGDLAQFAMPGLGREATEFAVSEGIVQYLPTVRDLVFRCFSSVESVQYEMESDPDTGEMWLSVNAKLSGSPVNVVEEYGKFTECWLAELPEYVWDAIRLSYCLD